MSASQFFYKDEGQRERVDHVHYGNTFHGPVIVYNNLINKEQLQALAQPSTENTKSEDEPESKATELSEQEIDEGIEHFEKVLAENEGAFPPGRKKDLQDLKSSIRRLREENRNFEAEIESKEKEIDETLVLRAKLREEPKTESVAKKLQDLKTFLSLLTDVECSETKLVFHMIEAQDLVGLQEVLQDDVKRMFGIHECDSDYLEGALKETGNPKTLKKRLADLRALITSHLDEDEQEVRMVIRMIDNQDVANLKLVLTEDTKRRFGFMDEEAKSGDGAGTSGGKGQAKDKSESKSVRDMKRLAQAIRGGIAAEIEETVKTVTGKSRVPAFISGNKQASSDTRDHDAEKTGDDSGVKEVEIQQGRGHIRTIKTNISHQPVTGLVFMQDLNVICVAHFRSSDIWVYDEDGFTLGSFVLAKMKNPSGMVVLKSKDNTVAISDFYSKRIHLVTVSLTGDKHAEHQNHVIWKLVFQPSDVSNFKANVLLVASMRGEVSMFTEEGKHIGTVAINYGIEKLYSAMYTGKEMVLVDCNDEESAILWANLQGDVTRTYNGKKDNEQPMDDPLHVLQDDKGQLLVADHDNNRIHLLGKDGKFQQFLLQRGDGIYKPRRIHLDTSGSKPRLFVGCGGIGDAQVRVYDYRALTSMLVDFEFEESLE